MSPRPTVSVVIPVRDDAPALDRCLRALRAQTWPPDDVVVVDNGSTDDSAAVARRHGARVVWEPRPGIPHAAATGYDAARGEILVRCDADTRPGRRWIERLAGRLVAHEELDAVTGIGTFYDVPRCVRAISAAAYLGSYYACCHLALGHPVLWGSNMAMRRRSWAAASAAVHRDEDVHDDMDLAFVLGPRSRLRIVAVPVGVSARSLRGREQRRRRWARARRTLEVNWRLSPPWLRWRDHYQPIVSQIRSWVSRKPLR